MNRPIPKGLLRSALGTAALLALSACGGGEELDSSTTAAGAEDRATTAAADGAPALASAGPAVGTLLLASASAGGAAGTASSATCAVSADGSRVLFFSTASNLVPGDTNGASDLFLKNLVTGEVVRVTTQSNGAQLASGGSCGGTSMTPDGRTVAFNAGNAVFVKDTQTGMLTQASPPAGTVPQVTGYFGGVLSDDGTKLVFRTLPETRYAGAYNFINVVPARLMLRDLSNGSLVVLATDNGVVADGEIVTVGFSISPDGQRVAFLSSSASLVPGDTNASPDVFVRDLASGTTVRASTRSDGTAAGRVSYDRPRFVSNTAVAFGTGGTSSLGPSGLYVKDLGSGALTLALSRTDGGADAVLSGDARKVAFNRFYSGFDTRVFVRDLATGQETLVSATASGTASNGSSTGAVISRDGSTVAFGSSARNLVSPRPPAGVFQVYAKVIDSAAPAAALAR
jgi:Tol biopolymer transport system component